MTANSNPLISIIIVTYNGILYVSECLDSIICQTYKNFEIVVVDNSSSDGTIELIETQYPQVKLVVNKVNSGYSGGCSQGLEYACGDYIALVNQDVVLDKDWLLHLVMLGEKYPKTGAIASNVLFYDDPELVNAYGNEVHYTGLVFSRFMGKSKSVCKLGYVTAPSGAAFLIRRSAIDDVGFIDKDFFMEYGDIDFMLRILLKGWTCLITPFSKAYHKFILKMDPNRLFILERGRYLMLFKNYHFKTLVFLLPSLLLTEIVTWGYALSQGKFFLTSKIMAYSWVLKNLKQILEKRNAVQQMKTIKESTLLSLTIWELHLPKQWLNNQLTKVSVRVFNRIFEILYKITLRFV